MKVTVTPDLVKAITERSKAERREIGEAITLALQSWGKSHIHSGISIRKLKGNVYECRVGLANRLVFLFQATPPELIFYFMGNHDEVKNHLKTL